MTFKISDTVIEDRFGVEHGSPEWYAALEQHFKWLLQYKISPYFCKWGNSMRVLTYTSPWPGMISQPISSFKSLISFGGQNSDISCSLHFCS